MNACDVMTANRYPRQN